jgi:hypothetical protein
MELMNHTINQTCPSRFWYISYKKVDMVLIGFEFLTVARKGAGSCVQGQNVDFNSYSSTGNLIFIVIIQPKI